MTAGLSIVDKLLCAALNLENEGKRRFSAEDLVVSAWKAFPDVFGLAGYTNSEGVPIYPNSNRVYAEIMGSKPVRKQGLIKKVGSKIYTLTEAGRSRAIALTGMRMDASPQKWSLAREKIAIVERLFESKAATKAREGKSEELSFYDACSFWGISPRCNAKDLSSRFAEIEAILQSALHSLTTQGDSSVRHGGISYAKEDISALLKLQNDLKQRFQADLQYIRNRIHDR